MNKNEMLAVPTYKPEVLLDSFIEAMHLKNDAALARALKVAYPVISKIRHRKLHLGPAILIRMHEISDLHVRVLKAWAGISA